MPKILKIDGEWHIIGDGKFFCCTCYPSKEDAQDPARHRTKICRLSLSDQS